MVDSHEGVLPSYPSRSSRASHHSHTCDQHVAKNTIGGETRNLMLLWNLLSACFTDRSVFLLTLIFDSGVFLS